MKLFQEMIIAADYKVTEGSEYLWKCYGPNARFLDFKNEEFEIVADMVFDSKNQTVYSASLFLKDKCYRWLNPEFIQNFKDESYDKNIDPRVAYEGVNFHECDIWSDFTQKVNQAFTTGKCDEEILISINITDEFQNLIDQLPKGTNIEKMVNDALLFEVEKMKASNQKNWNTLKDKLPGIKIEVNEEQPLGSKNIKAVADWILSLNEPYVRLHYSDKEVKKGLLSILKKDDNQFQYVYKNK